MAPVYDAFVSPYDLERWTGGILAAVEAQGIGGNRLFDVACGTGESFIPMMKRGWEVTGCDISPSMLALAREKVGEAVPLALADMRKLPRFGEFDLVWALGDACNYLMSSFELEQTLRGMSRNLAPEGVLAFDVSTIHGYRTFFAETEAREKDGLRLIWRGQASSDVQPGSICEALFEVGPIATASDGSASISMQPHSHRQRHFALDEVLATIDAAGLECLDVIGQDWDTLVRPLDELVHNKAVYIARLAGSSQALS
jgi:ubiquinone/menaquinone biosynthesis C-methylase UbiE